MKSSIPEKGKGAKLVSGAPSRGGGTAFAQVNPGAAELLRDHVLEACQAFGPNNAGGSAGSDPGRFTAIDAYCGIGKYGRLLAEHGWSVTGIEVDHAAAVDARVDAPQRFEVVESRVEEVLGAHLPVELLLVNPPRSGLHADVPSAVMGAPPRHIVYVSCDPGTLARDLRALSDAYELVGLKSFDLFPQTAHVETVAVLTMRSEGS